MKKSSVLTFHNDRDLPISDITIIRTRFSGFTRGYSSIRVLATALLYMGKIWYFGVLKRRQNDSSENKRHILYISVKLIKTFVIVLVCVF